jgi:hypothetical protein
MLLELALAVLAFSLPMDLFRARLPFWPARQRPSPPPRRAPLAEHAWEEHVLHNLTASE